MHRGVVDAQAEHAAEPEHHAGKVFSAHVLVQPQDGVGIACASRGQAGGGELRIELSVVVDLAVEDDAHTAVPAPHGLVAAGDIDDGQAGHAKGEVLADKGSRVVGTTMVDHLEHRPNDARGALGGPEDSGDTAHAAWTSFAPAPSGLRHANRSRFRFRGSEGLIAARASRSSVEAGR